MSDFPTVVCLCGSTRFAAKMNEVAAEETLAGNIVIRPEVVTYSKESDVQFVKPETKILLDVLHFRKIEMADEVLVVNVDDYIGESTAREIAYAESLGKPVRYYEHFVSEPPEFWDKHNRPEKVTV